MIGNAVPPSFSKALGECLTSHERGEICKGIPAEVEIAPEFYHWLRDEKKLTEAGIESVGRLARRALAMISPRQLNEPADELRAFDQIAQMRPSLATDKERDSLREAMLLLYECALNASAISLEEYESQSHDPVSDRNDHGDDAPANGNEEEVA